MAVPKNAPGERTPVIDQSKTSILHPNIHRKPPPIVASGKGSYLMLEDGRRIFEACAGPAVACLGHGNTEVTQAVVEQMQSVSYCFALNQSNRPAEELAKAVIETTNGKLAKGTIMSSGSEAVEAAMKLAVKYFAELGVPNRAGFIARAGAFHGTTLGSLALSGKVAFRKPFEPLLKSDMVSFVSMPNMYRGMLDGETTEEYVERLACELDAEFELRGPNNVCAFIAETVSGSALGCHTAPPGYFKAIKAVCDKHSALLILDEVFCGIGRTGTYHAWQQEDVVPDIQTVAKGVAGGYAPVAMMLVHQRVVDAINGGSGVWNHGHTFSSHPVACAAGVAVQRIIKREGLVENSMRMGERLGAALRAALSGHPNVGDIRGRGLMWAVEFVKDKATKQPFPAVDAISARISQTGLSEPWNVYFYPGAGTADGISGDHITIAPAYTISEKEVDLIVAKLHGLLLDVLG
ncbi:aminotransferase [Colletotrichum nymphaeae SA-01]|uniref:Aminotransferase n=1 Tax=Colletotrichum nymphaeae SA-01 TaxID=1460502 RepID=A0A135TQT9_9PEZI|nr:aminotransferase [Colletotrichum nymphaeae SA-01]